MTVPSDNNVSPAQVTRLLVAWGEGQEHAFEQLVPLVDAELRRIARCYIRKEGPGHTLEPTALVNEAYLRLIEWKTVDWQNRAHFFAVAAKMMRRILVTHAIRKQRRDPAATWYVVSAHAPLSSPARG